MKTLKKLTIPIVLVIAGLVVISAVCDHLLMLDRQWALNTQRDLVRAQASVVHSKIENEANSTFFLISGLAATIGGDLSIGEEDFKMLAADILKRKPYLQNVSAARDFTIRYVYPLAGNEQIIGRDYRDMPDQWPSVRRVAETGHAVLAGPVDLVQGGQAFIARFPVFANPLSYGGGASDTPLWGILSMPIRLGAFYRQTGIEKAHSDIRIALRGTDGQGNRGAVFLGREDWFAAGSDAVLMTIRLPGNSEWILAAKPTNGWIVEGPDTYLIYGTCILIAVIYIAVVSLILGYIRKERHQRQLEGDISEAKSHFIANMSHEMRTPLNSIIGFIDLTATTTPLTDKQRDYLETAGDAAHHLLRIVNDTLDLALLQAGRLSIVTEPVDIAGLVSRCGAAAKRKAAVKSLDFACTLENGIETAALTTDPSRVRQIVDNLLDNAIKFTSSGSINLSVRIATPPSEQNGAAPAEIVIEVRDTGCGIAPEAKSRMFGRFEQVHKDYARSNKGAGLGLAICRDLAARLGGRITLESDVGKGSMFRLFLPLDPPAEEKGTGKPPAPEDDTML